MRSLCPLALMILLAVAAPASAQPASDPLDQPVEGTSEPLPSGVRTVSPDSLTVRAQSPDAEDADSGSPDAPLAESSPAITGHAESPDAITTQATDLSDLPAASVIDAPVTAVVPASMPVSAACARPSGDAQWSGCLADTNRTLARANARLEAAEAAYSRSITGHVLAGEERREIIAERDAASAEVTALRATLASQVSQAQQSGVSSWVTAPYQPQGSGW